MGVYVLLLIMASFMLLEAGDCLEVRNLGLVWLTGNISPNHKRLPIKYQFLLVFRKTKIMLFPPIPMVVAVQLDPSHNILTNQLLGIILVIMIILSNPNHLITHWDFMFDLLDKLTRTLRS